MDFRKATDLFADPEFDGDPVQIYKVKEGEEIILYERRIGCVEELMNFQKYLSKLIMVYRGMDIDILGGLIFRKYPKNNIKRKQND